MDVSSWFMQLMTDTVGNPEEERRTEFYHSPWVTEAVGRYIFTKVSAWYFFPLQNTSDAIVSIILQFFVCFQVQQRRQELEQVLGIRLT